MPTLLSKKYLDLLTPEEWEGLAFINRFPNGFSRYLYDRFAPATSLAKYEVHEMVAVRDGRVVTTLAGQLALATWRESEGE